MKKILAIFFAFTIFITGCSQDVVIANKSFINALEKTNNQLLEVNENINGELLIKVSAGVNYKSSSAEIGLNSNSQSNNAYYETQLSAETLLYLLNSISKKSEDNSSAFSSVILYSKGDKFDIGKEGNNTDNILSFDAKALEKFYEANKLFLASDKNKAVLGETLNEYQISSNLVKDQGQTKYVTSLTVTVDQLKNMIPFINLNEKEYKGEIKLYFYQDDEKSPITKIDLILYDYTFTGENDFVYFNANVAISLVLPTGGENNE